MKLRYGKTEKTNSNSGRLFARKAPAERLLLPAAPGEVSQTDPRGKHRMAFLGLYTFTLLLYWRPHELWPGVLGPLSLPKIVAVSTILIYCFSKLSAGEKLLTWTLELKMAAIMWVLGVITLPVAASPKESFDVLFDPFSRTVIVFILLISLVDTRERLKSLLFLLVLIELLFSISGIKTFLAGDYGALGGQRIFGWGTMFSNPNDFASLIDLLLPFAVIFALLKRGVAKWVYFACAGLAAAAVFCTFSRSAFLGLIALAVVIAWKLARISLARRVKLVFSALIVSTLLMVALPGSYRDRIATIFNPDTDTTNSAQERQLLMQRAAELAIRRSVVGVGMGNFHIYSFQEKVAHNSYLEIAAELGALGLIAYLVLIFAPIISLRRIERETSERGAKPDRELYVMSVCFQASLVAFIIYAFFGSVQYFPFLYYIVGFGVALRRIHHLETRAAVHVNKGADELGRPVQMEQKKGMLWRPRRGRRGLLIEGSR